MKRIVAGAAAVCALALAGAWWAVDAATERREAELLGRGCEHFGQMIECALDAALWYAGSMAAYMLDYSTAPRSVAEMQELAEKLYMDELTVVGSNGIAVASNYGEYVGFDWRTTPETAAYLELFAESNRVQYLGQPFRRCVINHDNYRKFGAVSFTNRLGLVQVGYSMDKLVETMAWTDAGAFRKWRFGQSGRFGAYDRDGDGLPDPAGMGGKEMGERGRINHELARISTKEMRGINTKGGWKRLAFPFAGRMFYAELPEREFGDQRRVAMAVAAGVIVLLVAAFAAMLVQLRRAADRLERMHREKERRAAEDLRLAHTIQMSTLPRSTGTGKCEIGAMMIPAREVGGDFYDFFPLADGREAFVIGDVSGKGVPAAMFMLLAKNAIRQALHEHGEPAEALAAANAALCAENDAEMFVTVFLAVMDVETGEVAYVNAGHNRPMVLRNGRDGLTVEQLRERGGRMMGLFEGIGYRASRLRLARGERLFLYTDGVTEAQDANGRLYGEARLREVLGRGRIVHELTRIGTKEGRGVCEDVKADVARFVAGAEASDDLTMLEIAWRG